ncbi:MAG: HAD family phosphatase [Coriobacteriales bacterium]|jgi:HAD superfamily hydrolase (TIGR01509 family)
MTIRNSTDLPSPDRHEPGAADATERRPAAGGLPGTRAVPAAPLLWPPTFDGAIFDFDGTIAFSSGIWEQVDREFLGERGLRYTPQFAAELSVLGFAEGSRYVVDHYHLDEDPDAICAEWNRIGARLYGERVTLRQGARAYIEALRSRGVRVALATTNDANVIDAMKPRVDADELFDARVHGAEVARSKNHPDIYLEAARRIGVRPRDCIVFEDIVPGLRAAMSTGMTGCAVRSDGRTQKVDALRSVADLWLDRWTDIDLHP